MLGDMKAITVRLALAATMSLAVGVRATEVHAQETAMTPELIDDITEAFVEVAGNRLKVIRFAAVDSRSCPQTVSLVSAREARIDIWTPKNLLQGGYTTLESDVPNEAGKLTFYRDRCRYIVFIKRYDVIEGKEAQLSLSRRGTPSPDPDTRSKAEEILRRLQAARRSLPAERNSAAGVMDRDAQGVLFYLTAGTRFMGAAAALEFSGIMFFGVDAATILLANVLPDVSLDIAVDGGDANIAVLNIRRPNARIELSIHKEILIGNQDWKIVPLR